MSLQAEHRLKEMVAASDVPRAVIVIVDGDVEVVLGYLVGLRVDLALVDALARVHLAARRAGSSLRVRNPDPELCELLELVGLADLVAPPS